MINGDRYLGEWKANKKEGCSGRAKTPALRKVYAGEWKDDRRHGFGTYYYEDGSYYEGMWADDQKEGWGKMNYADGSVYEGEWHREMRHGQGIYLLRMWLDDQKEGPGRFIFKTKRQAYEGEWFRGMPKCGTLVDLLPLPGTMPRKYPIPPPNLPADLRVDIQRRIKALNLEISKKKQGSVEQKFHEKYKYIKHVEKTKVQRLIKRLEKQQSAGSAVEEELHEALVSLNYIDHYPKDMKYISLFPKSSGSEAPISASESDTDRMRSKIRESIRKAMESGDLQNPGYALRKSELLLQENSTTTTATTHEQTTSGKKLKSKVVKPAEVDQPIKSKGAKVTDSKTKKEQRVDRNTDKERKSKKERSKDSAQIFYLLYLQENKK
ncbi:18S rRNA maturation protein [Phlyctochytrium bullatum]|nr:18S rRNA maturation protein [Phlyctochytrium bullatum]